MVIAIANGPMRGERSVCHFSRFHAARARRLPRSEDQKSSASLNGNLHRFRSADLPSAEYWWDFGTFLVILLVILCTGIRCSWLRRHATRDILLGDSFLWAYAAGVQGLASPCNCGKTGLKIRRGQPRGGSIPPPGTNVLSVTTTQPFFKVTGQSKNLQHRSPLSRGRRPAASSCAGFAGGGLRAGSRWWRAG
jgi:hypothetical protein